MKVWRDPFNNNDLPIQSMKEVESVEEIPRSGIKGCFSQKRQTAEACHNSQMVPSTASFSEKGGSRLAMIV